MFWHLYGQEVNAMEKGQILSALMILNQANLYNRWLATNYIYKQ